MKKFPEKKIYTIAPYASFIDSLACFILEEFASDPKLLGNVEILLPTTRACRALQHAFLKYTDNNAIILPNIQSLNDINEEEALFTLSAFKNLDINLPRVISSNHQRLLLTSLVKIWQDALPKNNQNNMSLANQAYLAVELSSFLAEIQKHQLSLDALENLVPEDLAEHWQITLHFLRILIDHWPKILAEKNLVDPAEYRNLIINTQCEYWDEHGDDKIIIAAGTTASIPSVAKLLKSISKLDKGIIILPGLDTSMPEDIWEVIEQSHPQYGMKNLLEILDYKRENVGIINIKPHCHPQIELLTSYLNYPANMSDRWRKIPKLQDDVINHLSYIEVENQQEEAEIIAIFLRKTLDEKDKQAALITHDRILARKVAAVLAKWGIKIDDSAGMALGATPPMVFLRLIIDLADNSSSMQSLIALLKHPFCACGKDPVEFRHVIYEIEKKVLRGKAFVNKKEQLIQLLQDNNLSEHVKIIENIYEILQSWLECRYRKKISLTKLLQLHINTACKLACTDELSGSESLFGSDVGRQISQMLDDMLISSYNFQFIEPADYRGLFEALIAGKVYRPSYGKNAYISILSPIEARMLHFDTVILGSMNEGSWPGEIGADPWMSRQMRSKFGLPLPERKIGLAAHDFAQMLASPEVIITKARKVEGLQTIPSRFLSKLQIIIKLSALEDKFHKNSYYRDWLKYFAAEQNIISHLSPTPKPPIYCRPKKLSVTAIEEWMRDPYSLYAKKILNLKQLEPIDNMPSIAEFGNIIHSALEKFIKNYDDIDADKHLEYILAFGDKMFEKYLLHPLTKIFWRSKLINIAHWIIETENLRKKNNIKIFSEIEGILKIKDFELSAKADRIENDRGKIIIIDYKTGSIPKNQDIDQGISSQLILEALIAQEGGFKNNINNIEAIYYWQMTGNASNPVKKICIGNPEKLNNLIICAKQGLEKLIETFNSEDIAYLSVPDANLAPRYNNYLHLARFKEWE